MYLLKFFVSFFIITVMTLFIVSCDQVAETNDTINRLQDEGIAVETRVTLTEWQFKQIAGVTYLAEVSAGVIVQCFVIDNSGQTLYSEEFLPPAEQDALRTIQPTAEEIENCA